jgi:AraC family transcriptional regulator, transcriptional activator of the genes for pyochelin and ferripyochelin receptors
MLVISAAGYTALWDDGNPIIQCSAPNNDREIIYNCPELLGQGYERSIELHGIELLFIDRTYDDDLRIVMAEPEDRCIEFGFNLAGTSANRSSGQNFLQWGLDRNSSYEIRGRDRILKVDIHLDSIDILQSFLPKDLSQLPPALIGFTETGLSPTYDDLGTITPAMKLALEQIIACPYQGLTKHL